MHFNQNRVFSTASFLKLSVAFACLLALSLPLSAQELQLETKTGLIKFSLKELKSQFKTRALKVYDPFDKQVITYRGFVLNQILDKHYPSWKTFEFLDLESSDGYQPRLKVEDLKKHQTLLAFEKVGSDEFGSIRPGKGYVSYQPFLLVWNNFDSKELRAKNEKGWAWSVSKLLSPKHTDPYFTIKPKGKFLKNASVMRGFAHYKSYCIKCHSVKGIGGAVGPSLADPVSVTSYWKKEALQLWILDPQSIRKSSKMMKTHFDVTKQSEKQIVNDLYNYLNHFN